MSYCRWSSLNYQCDVYAYADVDGGYTIHIARMRSEPPAPKMPLPDDTPEWTERFEAWQAQWKRWSETRTPTPIGGPFDGASYNEPTLEAFRDRMAKLRDAGYRFPEGVIAAIEEEIADGQPGRT